MCRNGRTTGARRARTYGKRVAERSRDRFARVRVDEAGEGVSFGGPGPTVLVMETRTRMKELLRFYRRRGRPSRCSITWRTIRRGVELRFPPCCVAHYTWDVACGASPAIARWRQIEFCRDHSCRAVPCGVFHRGDSPLSLTRRVRNISRFTRSRLSTSATARRRRELDPWHSRRPKRVCLNASAFDFAMGYRGFNEAVDALEPYLGEHVLVETLVINCAKGRAEFSGQSGEGLTVAGCEELRFERLAPPRDDDLWPYDRGLYFGSPARSDWPTVALNPKRLRWIRSDGNHVLIAQGAFLTRVSKFGRAYPRSEASKGLRRA